MKRGHLLLVLVALLVVFTGCLNSPGPSKSQLNQNVSYDWNTSADATIRVQGGTYKSVYDVTNRTTFRVYKKDTFNNRTPIDIRALKFRYRNGTVVNASAIKIDTNDKRVKLTLPNGTGQVAFTVKKSGKKVQTPTFVTGSYEVILPPGTGVGLPVFSKVSPGGYTAETIGGRVHLTWSKVTNERLAVDYYLDRDLLLFGGLFGILLAVAVGGSLYYWRQIRSLRDRREEVGLDVDDEDDDPRDQGPPPGMG